MKYPDEFENTQQLRDYTVELILNTGLTPSLKKSHPKVYKFFVSLFQRHPEKDRKEVSLITDISIRKFPISRKYLKYKDYQFFIIKSNGTEDSISWNKSIIMTENEPEKIINWAMRDAVKQQIADFKKINKNKPCELCSSHLNITADHVIKFKKLKDDFLLENPEYPKEFGKNKFGSEIFRDEDIEFAKLWQEYHKKNAILRILCVYCNEKLDNYTDENYNGRKNFK